MWQRFAVILCLAIASILGALGCGGSNSKSGPLALYSGEWNGDNGQIVGRVEREGSCLYIVHDPSWGIPRMLLAFSDDGVRWDEPEQAVRVAGKVVPVGAVLTAGGSDASNVAGIDWSVPPAPECNSVRVWLVGPPREYKVGGPLPVLKRE